ncbi:Uncharacterized protein dnm_083690 [Desulfonema magnum]|uniref:Uncharacterized protein n=1 Tax=Desulfonema magnum TaxID=45655 RepID=A0A975GSP8_9BACT|nr:Uncharacterized protein dnm_083690 [Desulfonema magnum]
MQPRPAKILNEIQQMEKFRYILVPMLGVGCLSDASRPVRQADS